MSTIEELLRLSELELEKNNANSFVVGNRPHYPMFLLFNKSFTQQEFQFFDNKIRRVWSQATQHLINYSYSLVDGNPVFFSLPDNAERDQAAILSRLDAAKKAGDVFASMRQWCVYHIIDTSSIKTLNDFVQCYNLYSSMHDIIRDNFRSMLIVLLDDSAVCRELSSAIRAHLSQASDYDSTVIISNRARDNSMCEMEELYRIATNIIILSNNDAISTLDDEAYNRRVKTLYSDTPLIVSYILRERPNRKIAVQIYNEIFDALEKQIAAVPDIDLTSWMTRLQFERARSVVCDTYLRSARVDVDTSALQFLPFQEGVNFSKLNLQQARYKDLKPFLFEDAFQSFLSVYVTDRVSRSIDIAQCAEQFKASVLQEFSSVELSGLKDATIDQLINSLKVGVVSEDLSLPDYFRALVMQHLKESIIYPKFRKVLEDLRDAAKQNLANIRKLHEEFNNLIPLSYEDVGTIYQQRAANFFLTGQADVSKRRIFHPEGKKQSILDELLNCFKEIVNANQDLFNLPFIAAWAMRLGLAGDQIYRMISRAITEDADETIRLYGNYPIDIRLKVLMLHTANSNGEDPTELYEYLRTTFKDDPHVQYFNTGYDDALEALYFFSCAGKNLLC